MGFYQHITRTYGRQVTYNMKKWSSLLDKLSSLSNRRVFLHRCKRNGVIPSHIPQHQKNMMRLLTTEDRKLRSTIQNFSNRLRFQFLNFELSITNRNLENIKKSLINIENQVKSSLPTHIFNEFKQKLEQGHQHKFNKSRINHKNKYNQLISKQTSNSNPVNKGWLVNLSNKTIPTDIEYLLSFGPKFQLHNNIKDLQLGKLLADIEYIINTVEDTSLHFIYRSKIINIITNFLQSEDKSESSITTPNFNKLFHKARLFLKSNPDLVVTRADKGNVTVIMDKLSYLEKISSLLDDEDTYSTLSKNPTESIQRKLNDLLSEIGKNNSIDSSLIKSLKCYNGISPKCYGLPKIHKPQAPLRPIVSYVGSPLYNISKFLSNVLSKSLLNRTNYNLKDTFTFVEEVKNFVLPQDFILISLDVVSLFTNISLDLVIQNVEKYWVLIEENTPFNKRDFIRLIRFVFNNNVFACQEKFFIQKFGTPMGSPISPIIATIVMDDLLDSVLPLLPSPPLFIFKYVDDLILSIDKSHIDPLLQCFNDYNPHLQFTIETEKDNFLPFLDCKVIHELDGSLKLDWYHKPTFSGRYLNYNSAHSFEHKRNVILGLKNRITKICHPSFHQKNFKLLCDILSNNGYPRTLLHNFIYNTPNRVPPVNINNNQQVTLKKYISIPFITGLTPKLISIFKDINIKIVPHNSHNINKIFTNLKDKTAKEYRSNLIYKIECLNCTGVYIGQTSQWLKKRIQQHKLSIKNNKETTALSQHAINKQHSFNFNINEVKVLDSGCNNYKKRLFLEMVHIYNNNNNCVNNCIDTQFLNQLYKYILYISNNAPT